MEFEGAKHAFHRYFGKSTHKALTDEISVLMCNKLFFFLSVYFNKQWNLKNKTLHIIYTYM